MQDDNRNESAFDKIKRRAEEADQRIQEKQSHLTPKKHKQLDFFIADLFDAMSFRDDIASMEHPLFALKAGDSRLRVYEHNGIKIEVSAAHRGIATIHDKDIWIYCISKLMQAMYEGEEISQAIRFTAYDFLITTNRNIGGRNYKLLADALERLKGTVITTSIETANHREKSGFGLIDSWRIIEKDKSTGRMLNLEVTLPNWLYRSVTSKAVLTISPDYFRLRKPLDRRIYELARKHCGHQAEFRINLDLLHKKTGVTDVLRNFRVAIRSLAESNELPDYFVQYDSKKDIVTFKNRNAKIYIKDLFDGNC